MAPSFRSAGTLAHGTGAVTPGAPAGLTSGDIELLVCESMDEAISLTTANGFAEVTGSPISVPSGTATIATRGALFWRRWNGVLGDPTVGDPGDHVLAQRFAFSGCVSAGDPWDFVKTSSEATEDTSGSATGSTTAGDDRLIAIFVGASKPDSTGTAEVSSFTNANLTSLTERADNAGDSGNGGHIGAATGVLAYAGHTGATTYTKATSAYKWHFVVALKASTPFIQAEMYNSSTSSWEAINPDVMSGTLTWAGGLSGSGPVDRVASPGTMEFELDNSAGNSGGLLGYYSPDHANKRTGWGLNTKVRVKLYDSIANAFKIWNYRVKSIMPIPGQYGPRRVEVTAMDYMEEFSSRKIQGVAIQTAQRGDELVTTLVAAMPFAPDATSYGTGIFAFPYALHAEQDEKTPYIQVLQKIAQSELSYIFVDGTSSGSTLYYRPHTFRYSIQSFTAFTNSMTELEVEHSDQNVWNDVRAVTNPVDVGTDFDVLAESPEEIPLEPGETKTIFLRYVDSDTGQRMSGTNLQALENGTDYRMASAPGTTNNDLSAFFTATPTTGGNTILVEIANSHTTAKGFVNLLQVRGNKITLYDQVESAASDSTSITNYGRHSLTMNMPYQSETTFGQAAATEVIRRYKDAATDVRSVSFLAKSGDAITANIVANISIAGPGGINLTETVTGLSTSTNKYFINGFEFEWLLPNVIRVTYLLERNFNAADPYFLIDDSIYGAINGSYLIAPY